MKAGCVSILRKQVVFGIGWSYWILRGILISSRSQSRSWRKPKVTSSFHPPSFTPSDIAVLPDPPLRCPGSHEFLQATDMACRYHYFASYIFAYHSSQQFLWWQVRNSRCYTTPMIQSQRLYTNAGQYPRLANAWLPFLHSPGSERCTKQCDTDYHKCINTPPMCQSQLDACRRECEKVHTPWLAIGASWDWTKEDDQRMLKRIASAWSAESSRPAPFDIS